MIEERSESFLSNSQIGQIHQAIFRNYSTLESLQNNPDKDQAREELLSLIGGDHSIKAILAACKLPILAKADELLVRKLGNDDRVNFLPCNSFRKLADIDMYDPDNGATKYLKDLYKSFIAIAMDERELQPFCQVVNILLAGTNQTIDGAIDTGIDLLAIAFETFIREHQDFDSLKNQITNFLPVIYEIASQNARGRGNGQLILDNYSQEWSLRKWYIQQERNLLGGKTEDLFKIMNFYEGFFLSSELFNNEYHSNLLERFQNNTTSLEIREEIRSYLLGENIYVLSNNFFGLFLKTSFGGITINPGITGHFSQIDSEKLLENRIIHEASIQVPLATRITQKALSARNFYTREDGIVDFKRTKNDIILPGGTKVKKGTPIMWLTKIGEMYPYPDNAWFYDLENDGTITTGCIGMKTQISHKKNGLKQEIHPDLQIEGFAPNSITILFAYYMALMLGRIKDVPYYPVSKGISAKKRHVRSEG